MNSFALLQDDVEDASIPNINAKTVEPPVPAVDVQDAVANQSPQSDQSDQPTPDVDSTKPEEPEHEKEMTFEEYLAKKKALSSGLPSLTTRAQRQPNDGNTPFEKMSLLRKNHHPEHGSIVRNVPVKEFQENKALKDSTQAAVARNAEIHKFFRKDPNDRRPRDARRPYAERRARGRGDRPRGRGRSRAGNRPDRERYNRDDADTPMNGGTNEPVPNVDDTAAFPSL